MSNKNGFTIIEILIVLVISSVFMSFSVAQYRDFSQRQSLTNAIRLIKSDLILAQKDAISGRKPQGFTPPCTGELIGYQFTIVNNSRYTISVECNTIPVGGTTSTLLKNINLPEGITLQGNDFMFLPLTQGVDTPTTLTVSDGTNNATINISANGQIN